MMTQTNDIPTVSNKSLLVSTISALVISVLIYFVVILPAEYNIDPTGIGKKLGLTVLSEPIPETTASNQNDTAANAHELREDVVMVTVPAGRGVEYKFDLNAFSNLTYDWKTVDQSNIYFDFHGEPAGDTTGYFESFTIATTNQMQGSTTVPFDGIHGWYWKNASDQDVVIELKTSGNYQVVGLK